MKNFDEIVFQSIIDVMDSLREDTNLASPAAKNLIARNIFANVMKACDSFLITSRQSSNLDESLILGD